MAEKRFSLQKFIPDRKMLVLLGILVLTFLVWGLQDDERARQSSATKKQERNPVGSLKDEQIVDMEGLQKEKAEPSSIRNLFAFVAPPPPPQAMRAEQRPEPTPVVCGDRICQPGENFENCPSDCQPPPPPEIPLRYIGYMQESGKPVVFLTNGKEVFMGRENDIIANKYRIVRISDDSVELGYLNLNQTRTIPFQGNGRS